MSHFSFFGTSFSDQILLYFQFSGQNGDNYKITQALLDISVFFLPLADVIMYVLKNKVGNLIW